LLQKQQVLEANAFSDTRNDYSAFMLYGKPREGQSLEEVRDLMLQQLDKIKKGEFSENLMKACVTDARYREMKSLENNSSRASKLVDAFIRNKPYDKYIHQIDEIAKLNKAQIVAFANQHFANNYVVSYKRKGEDKERHKVDKPKITPVVINRDTSSDFLKHISSITSKRLTPRFIDFSKDIKHDKLANGLVFDYIPNPVNRTFSLSYVYDMGSDNDREMALALSMLKYLGTDKFTPDSLSYELFRLGLSLDYSVARKSMRVSLSGVESSMHEGVQLMEHILHHVKADQAVYDTLVNDILKKRANDKLNKGTILFSGMADYARYGADNPFRNSLSEKELKAMNLQHLQDKLRTLESYPHKIFYYGQEAQVRIKSVLETNHKVPAKMIPYPPAKIFKELDNEQAKVYFYHFDMVQAEMIFMSKDELFNKELNSYINVFNEYFGAGLSSIVFQEIREKKALAYSASCSFSAPAYKEESHYVSAYVGTQADKLKDAEPAMMALLKEMPQAEKQFQNAREAAMIRMETDYITRADIYSVYQIMQNRGLDHDARKEAYEKLKTLSLNDLNAFFQKHIKGKTYTIVLIGNRDKVDINFLKSLGEYKELSPEDVFNY
jgi:predicted Zn-dependent peptidase